MRRLSVSFTKRDLIAPYRGNFTAIVQSYSRSVFGGPKQATIQLNGAEDALWQSLDMLRCGVLIQNDQAEDCWWGYVHAVKVQTPLMVIGATLDGVKNYVKVNYTTVDAQGNYQRGTTDAATDAVSAAEFGTIEAHVTINDASDIAAKAKRDIYLAQRAYPLSKPEVLPTRGDAMHVTLECRGWWATLDWRFFTDTARVEAWTENIPPDTLEIANDGSSNRRAQSFQLPNTSDAWWLSSLETYIERQTATPVPATLLCELWSHNAGTGFPNAALASTSIATASIPGIGDYPNFNFTRFTFDPPYYITGASKYWFVLRYAGDTSGDMPPLRLRLHGLGNGTDYPRGSMARWAVDSGGIWIADAWTTNDWHFRVNGVLDTTEAIRAAITGAGQFITGVDVPAPSGVYADALRDGESTALRIVTDLLGMGTGNKRRLLATVSPARRLLLWEEPDAGAPAYYLTRRGLTDPYGASVDKTLCPVGMWLSIEQLVKTPINAFGLTVADRTFIDEAQYTVSSDTWQPTARNIESVWSIGVNLA